MVLFQKCVQYFDPLVQWFMRRRFVCEFPIGFHVKLSSAVRAILVEGPNRRTHFRKREPYGKFTYKSSPHKPLDQLHPNFGGMVLGMAPFQRCGKWFHTRRLLWEFPIGFYVKLSSAVVAILVGGLK
jgi:hypothetical protein